MFPRKYQYSNVETREIIISQYPPHSWGNIYRLKFKVIDKPGITEKITKVLVNKDININTQESEMTRSSSFFTVSMVADFSDYLKMDNLKFDNIEKKRSYLEKKFKDLFEQEFHEKLERFNLKKVNFLNYNSKEFKSPDDNSIDNTILNGYYDTKSNSLVEVIQKKITVEKRILDDLNIFKKINPNNISYTINSDTEEKYLLLRFFNANQCVIQFDIGHNNVKGAINKFAKAIRETNKDYNIINSYNRLENFNKKAHWIVMIDCTSNPDDWSILLNKFQQINTVNQVKVISYTNAFQNHSSKELPKIISNVRSNKLKELESENSKLKQNMDDTIVNFHRYKKIIIGIIAVFFVIINVFLYYAFNTNLDANKIIEPISYISIVSGVAGAIALIIQSSNFFKKMSITKTKNDD